jgi:hypothetical protein
MDDSQPKTQNVEDDEDESLKATLPQEVEMTFSTGPQAEGEDDDDDEVEVVGVVPSTTSRMENPQPQGVSTCRKRDSRSHGRGL